MPEVVAVSGDKNELLVFEAPKVAQYLAKEIQVIEELKKSVDSKKPVKGKKSVKEAYFSVMQQHD